MRLFAVDLTAVQIAELVHLNVGTNHINGIEGFWGLAKVRLLKLRGMSKNMFYLNLKECEFRFNYRNQDLYKVLLKITGNFNFC